MTKQKNITLDDLIDKLAYLNNSEVEQVRKSYDFASKVYFSYRLTFLSLMIG